MADESEEAVRNYIVEGDLYAIHFEDVLAGVILFISVNDSTVELKNLAVIPEFRGRGIGKASIKEGLVIYKNQGKDRVIVGTANSSIDNIAFYQKAGFRMYEIKRNFFFNYPEPIFEYGIRAMDMIMFEKTLM
ncbi:GNAT family N-acetyltransferase [Rossellomorea vietnamensis]|uniref:GNAT family N-acetyltransferase n=2 Tax=Rossellomorea vietnamensis TaxID=218284 RepID=A0A5D4NYV8_9BACI|nr:GNAT family N-acetyltransferase [Rossellomorea vietnamensis]